MFCNYRFLLFVITQVLVLLLKLGYGENIPFHINETMVEFPSIPALKGVKLSVNRVDYEFQLLVARDPNGCLPSLILKIHNSSIYPLEYYPSILGKFVAENVTFFNCSSVGSRYLRNEQFSYSDKQDMFICPIYAINSQESVLRWDLASCTVMFQFIPSPIYAQHLQMNLLFLKWSQPKPDVEKQTTSKRLTIVLPPSGAIVLLLLFVVCFYTYFYFKKKGDDQERLEKFLKDYKALKPTRFSYADIKRITNHFKDKLGEGAHGTVFKGKLSSEIEVAVKVLSHSDNDGQDFINEMGTMGKIHHINVVRLLGFCADGVYRALFYDFYPNGSLQKFISSPDNKQNFLGWSKLLQIAVDIAKGIEYLHQGCDYRIVHFDINPHNVLLDNNLTPKISDFGLAKLCSKTQSTVSMMAARGTLGYMAPEVFSQNFGHVSYKSDIYSYGMLLLEMVGGRKNVKTNQETFQVLYPKWINNLIEGRDVSIYIEDEFDTRITKKLAIVGLWCIQWQPISRPSIKTVIQMLEGEVDKLKLPSTSFEFGASTTTNVIFPARHLKLELEVIQELE